MIDEIEKWIIENIEVKNEIFGNMPICPYAKVSRLKGFISYLEMNYENDEILKNIILNIDKSHEYKMLILYDDKNILSCEQMLNFELSIYSMMKNYDIIHFHKDEDFNISGFRTRQSPYPFFTIADKKLLFNAVEALKKTRYYDNWNLDNLKFVRTTDKFLLNKIENKKRIIHD